MEPMIRISKLKKTFSGKKEEVHAIEEINLDINQGEIYGIIGMSGAGKSTLIRCMNFLEKPTSGTIEIEGKNLALLSGKELNILRQDVAMIFQHFNLLMQRTVSANVSFSMEIAGVSRAERKKRIKELLEIVGLSDKADAYPAQLSGGQKQRVAIARALATNPKIILCDEATSALDPKTTESILGLLKDINKKFGITIVIITHEMAVVEAVCTHVAILDKGKVAEKGKVEDIFSKPNSEVAKQLIFRKEVLEEIAFGKRCIRLVFDGKSSFEPIVSNLILECKVPVNILFADMKDIAGKALGHMILQLPNEKIQGDKVIAYLEGKNIEVEEVIDYV